MFAGFDYGTSSCAIGVVDRDSGKSSTRLLPINSGQAFMPSTLYAVERALICESVAQRIVDPLLQQDFLGLRGPALAQARRVRNEYDIRQSDTSVFVGQEAVDQYLALPGDGYFVKSPKSFLGASGLRTEFVQFFEDIVTAMMQSIKQRAEQSLGQCITHTVIGRPVNFQGVNAQQSNRQAVAILTIAAKRAGFKSVEFLFEPIAAGLDFEARLNVDKTVLVVDVGGGTTDCAMVRMGPSHRYKIERQDDFIGHSGERIGGNDLDIQMAGCHLMPLFGMQSMLKNGLPMPTANYWDAVSTNNVGAQANFYSLQTEQSMSQNYLDTCEPNLFRRFINLREKKQNHLLVRHAEQGKIALSDQAVSHIDLADIEPDLSCSVSLDQYRNTIERPLAKIVGLMHEAISQAGCQPELIYVTGGSAKSPVIQQAIAQQLGAIEVLDGDHFGSVAAGLTVWAQRLFS